MNANHTWKFFRAGGFDQVKLETGADLLAIDQLDQKLWVALACPTTGLEFDAKTLAAIDSDKDGRIRVPELIAAVKWAASCLKNPDELLKSSPSLALSSINDSTPEGVQLLASARQILSNLGKKDATAITVDETTDTTKIFAQTQFNGDGIVPVDSAADEDTKAVMNEIMACFGSELDRSGKPGISQAKADKFFAEAQAFSDWWKKAESDPTVLPLVGSTAVAAASLKAVKTKIDDYFTRCRLAAFDPRAVTALNRDEKDYLALAAKELSANSAEIVSLPIAMIGPGKALPLKAGINPAWSGAIATFESELVRPLAGEKTSITESDWAQITAKFSAYESWNAGKTGVAVENLGLPRVRAILAGKAKETVAVLIAKDKALEPEANTIDAVDKLVRFHANLYKLLVNFVSFRDFYQCQDKAIFQAGTLYLDQRSCELCLSVEDVGKHGTMAALAGTYLAYCDCVRKGTGEKRQIVAAFTDGDSDNLMVGRNGIFYDRKGLDWDATITKIVDNPISIRQAFWAPYKKLVRMVEEQVAKRAAAADAAANEKLAQAATAAAKADPAAVQQAAKPAEPKKLDIGVVAALGVAFGAIGTALATFATGVTRLAPWQIPLVAVAIILLISLPSMLIAWLKLRRRNLGPILDANGWAVNARAKISVPFGGSLTKVASLPPGSQKDSFDPFAEKRSPWPKVIILVLILWIIYSILNGLGYINEWTNGRMGSPKSVKPASEQTTPADVTK